MTEKNVGKGLVFAAVTVASRDVFTACHGSKHQTPCLDKHMHTMSTISESHADRLIAGFTALAVAIHILEAAFPSPLPGVKPGLANIITLIVLLRYGWRLALWVGLLRVLVSSLLLGTFLTPTFILSFSGQLASLLILGMAWLTLHRAISIIGFSMLAAMAHMAGQIAIAWLLFIPHPVIWQLTPILLAAALGLGLVSGIIARGIVTRLPPAPTAPC